MAKLPQFPQVNDKGNPFLNDGQSEVEFVDGIVKDGPPQDPVPAFVIDVKIIKSSNPMNAPGQIHTVRVKTRGFSWGRTVQTLLSAFGALPKMAISTEVAEALLATGKLKGRKAIIQQTTKANEKGASWREFEAAPVDTTPVL